MKWSQQKVLVTGAGGFIGSHLTERLVTLGARTRAFDLYNIGNRCGWLEGSPVRRDVEVFLGDIRDPSSLRKSLAGVDVVFHLAALIAIPYSYEAPLSYLQTNAEGTLNLLQASRESQVTRVIHTSTSEVYGTARYVPINEEHPLCGQSPYSASKIAADKMAESFYLSYGLPVATVRPFNTYGPRQSARAVIPTIIAQALIRSEIELGSLTPTRDFNFVEDMVEGFIRAAESPQSVGQVTNLGSGKEVTIEEVVTKIQALLGKEIRIRTDGRRLRPEGSEVERLVADNRKAREIFGWESRIPLEVGLARTVEWMAKNLEYYRPDDYAL